MSNNEIILHSDPKGQIKVEVYFEDESFWLTQKKMAELFGVEVHTINYHLKEIFNSGELTENSVIRKIRITQIPVCYYEIKGSTDTELKLIRVNLIINYYLNYSNNSSSSNCRREI